MRGWRSTGAGFRSSKWPDAPLRRSSGNAYCGGVEVLLQPNDRARTPDGRAFARRADVTNISSPNKETLVNTRRYMIQRTFPAGALDGVTPDVKKVVNANNAQL